MAPSPTYLLPSLVCGSCPCHVRQAVAFGGQRPGLTYGRRHTWLRQRCASTSTNCIRPHSPRLSSTTTTHCVAGSMLCVTISRACVRSSAMCAMHPALRPSVSPSCVEVLARHPRITTTRWQVANAFALHLHHRQDADVLAAPRLYPRRAVTSPSAWRPTLLRAPDSRPSPPYLLVAPHGAADALFHRASWG